MLPGFGRFAPLDWGLGVELKGVKAPHWAGSLTSPRTFGHFGGAGACLTTRAFGAWSRDAWPRLSDAVLEELGRV